MRARANKIGGVVVEGWVERPAGMQDASVHDFVTYRFGPDGSLEGERKRGFTIDGQRLRDRDRGQPGG